MIRLRGVRHNNLKNFDLDLPLHRLIVMTGLSGSGKSSLAFDTLFAEGQRRYIETFSPYARQFFDRMDKPQVDSIEGIPPAIAIEQRNAVRTTRSTVGTMTEICDYMKMLWPHIAQLHCRQCGQPVRKDSPQRIWESLLAGRASDAAPESSPEVVITFDLPLSQKLSIPESLALVAKQGYQRLLLDGQIVRLEDMPSTLHAPRSTHLSRRSQTKADHPRAAPKSDVGGSRFTSLTVIQDRLRLFQANRPRFIEACEQAYHFGKGKLAIHDLVTDASNSEPKTQSSRLFSNRLHCAQCDIEYREPSPALFSFNNPVGACPACRGFGRIISIDYDLALPDRSKTLAEGIVKPWQTGMSAECQSDLLRACRHFDIPTDVPFEKLPKKWQHFVVEGEPDYGKDAEHEWPRAWYGVKGYFRWLESKSYKMHVRVLLSRYRAYTRCPECQGKRFQPEALLYGVPLPAGLSSMFNVPSRNTDAQPNPSAEPGSDSLTLADFYQLPIRDALRFIEALALGKLSAQTDPLGLMLNEVRSRLVYLDQVGLSYLTLDRPTRSLSGGETERVNLTTCLGTRLVNTLFVLDEPSVGLHPRDTERLVRILQQLRDAGNTVVVVEHEASVMRAADQLVDLGPGHGATGGQVVFQGTYEQILKSRQSLTGQYLSGALRIEAPQRRQINADKGAAQRASFGALALNEAAVPYGDRPGSAEIPAGEFQSRTGVSPVLSGADARKQERVKHGQGCRPSQDRDAEVDTPFLKLSHATLHNLNDLTVAIPLGKFVCVTGVSGSGKSTLVRDVLLPALAGRLKSDPGQTEASDRLDPNENGEDQDSNHASRITHHASLEGREHLDRVVLVDQSILGKTPRSNPAVYIGAFDDIREFFAQSEPAKQRGLNASAFSFNSSQGQCERCRGAGFEKIEMQFLSDVFIRCPACDGRRYRPHILEVKLKSSDEWRVTSDGSSSRAEPRLSSPVTRHSSRSVSIADLLESTVEQAIEFLAGFPESRPAQRAVESLRLLEEVGLGYLQLGQPINTLSGGESQRLKLVRHLAEAVVAADVRRLSSTRNVKREVQRGNRSLLTSAATLFLFDEPTTGLHFDDVRVLLKVFHRLVDAGHSVVVIEHNLEVIKCADWIIDLGPEAGDQGGHIVAEGTPEDIMACPASHTGHALRQMLSAPWGGGTEPRDARKPEPHSMGRVAGDDSPSPRGRGPG